MWNSPTFAFSESDSFVPFYLPDEIKPSFVKIVLFQLNLQHLQILNLQYEKIKIVKGACSRYAHLAPGATVDAWLFIS
jgi:hypothetical protein